MAAKPLIAALFWASLALAAPSSQGLIEAVQSDNTTGVARLIGGGADVNAPDEDGSTALAWAVVRGSAEAVELLLKAGADPNLANELGIGPLYLAIDNGFVSLARRLLNGGADSNLARENGETPLMAAARRGQVETVRALLRHGADVSARTRKFGQTALMWAAGYPEIVRLLLDHRADAQAITTSWDVRYTIYAPTTVTLGKTGIPWNTDGEYTSKKGGQNALFFAVQKHDIASARMLLEAGIDVNQAAADGTTPLLAALYHWDPPNTVFIPGKGAPAPAGSSQSMHSDLTMAEFLLDRGANVTVSDTAGYTPLHAAALAIARASLGAVFRAGGAYRGNPALLSLGPEDRQASPDTIVSALAIVKRLLDSGADPNRQTIYATPGPAGDVRINPAPPGSSAFHIAGSSTNVQLVKLLAEKGANANLLRKDGHTPFSVSVMAGNVDVVKEMVARGADLSLRYHPAHKIPDPEKPISLTRRDQTIMHLAALAGSLPVIEHLYSQGVPLMLKNSMGETPLALADHQERYREAIQREAAADDPERVRKVERATATTDGIRKILDRGVAAQ
jgi:ankyrin repeat protein